MRERCWRSASDESETGNAVSRLECGGITVKGHPVSETLGLRPRENRRCPKTPPVGGIDEAGTRADLLSRLAEGEIWPMGLLLSIFPLKGRDRVGMKIGGQITFVFTSFSRKRNRYDIVGNEYGADIPVISKTIVVDRKIHR
jgi:hypothetical protein